MMDGYDDEPLEMVDFWGQEIPGGGNKVAVEVENEPPVYHMVHVTNVALGPNPGDKPHVLQALYQGKPIVLATLDGGKGVYQAPLDFGLSSSCTFVNSGKGPVYLSGYITRSVQPIEGSDEEDEEDEEDEDEDDSDDEDAPQAIPLERPKPGKRQPLKFVDDEAEETDEGEDSDEEMEDDEDEDDEGEEDEDEEDEDEDDEDEEGDEFDRRLGAKSFKQAKGRGGGDSGSDEEDEGEGSEEDEEEDEDEDGLPRLGSDDLIAEAASDEDDEGESGDEDEDSDGPPEERQTAKRPAPASTPQPAKKQRKEEPKVPASAPPKVQQQQKQQQQKQQQQPQKQQQQQPAAAGDAEGQYLAAIIAALKAEGHAMPLAALGSKVKRPEGVKAKAKAFILAHADRLVFDEKAQTVALKK